MSGNEWTEKEDAHLHKCWEHESAEDIGAFLMRSRSSVLGRARRLGLSDKRAPVVEWTPEEDEFLRTHFFRKMTNAEIGSRLGRSREAVRRRATKLGLTAAKQASKPVIEPPEPQVWIDITDQFRRPRKRTLWDRLVGLFRPSACARS